ncbi:DUF2853 family protein [Sulfurovum sp.]|jgi:hypothetical protein|uniref:DUF2853 family protein n=1 Tax=Sulfurovum sp. TaxID=1969726 RepID=UPI002A35B941|nr:DUF2853 family protein [Sulfurovum sp.]MDD2451817.1 DUF2853 family protein [Sulfurovum sp.]MDD3499988.1 DUF2853 family protein [Sulfurovum sp.]MDY0402666.1 DUF2853 family protein [Sulfurovum sp.]
MSKLEEKVAHYSQEAKKLGLDLDDRLIAKTTESLVPAIYNQDAETVSCSDQSELETIKKNFLQNKLGLDDETEMDHAIQKVCEAMGSANRHKYRALFYALLVKEFGKESLYT